MTLGARSAGLRANQIHHLTQLEDDDQDYLRELAQKNQVSESAVAR